MRRAKNNNEDPDMYLNPQISMYKKQKCPGRSEIDLEKPEEPSSWIGKDALVDELTDPNGAISRKYSQTPSHIFVTETSAAALVSSEQAKAHYQYLKMQKDSSPLGAGLLHSRQSFESPDKIKWIKMKEDPALYQLEALAPEEPTKEERERQRLVRLQEKIRNDALQQSL
jgi:hypothetical protein